MPDSLDLAGIIGTWAAVFVAILALVGIVGPLLVFFNLRDQRSIALNAVDDRVHLYVGRGIRAWNRKRAFRRVNVPILTTPPQIPNFKPTNPKSRNKKKSQSPSTTGWIMFSNVLRNYGFDLEYGDTLFFENSESFLPVQKDWIFIIGLLGRYANRKDRGAPIGQIDNIPTALSQASLKNYAHLYGTTGAILITKRAGNNTTKPTVYFHGHSSITPLHLHYDDISLTSLVALYLGWLPTADGGFVKLSANRAFHSQRRVLHYRLRPASLDDLDTSVQTLFRRLGVKVVKLARFVGYSPWDLEGEEPRLTVWGRLVYQETDVYRLYSWALTMPWSPHSFLFRDEDNFLRENLSCAGSLSTAISAAAKVIKKLPGGQSLGESTESVSADDNIVMKGNLPIMIPFSRRTSAEWYRLDKDLRGVCGDKSAFVLVVSILCLEYSSLPSRILRGWLAHSAEDGVQIDSSVSEPLNPLKPLDQLPSAIIDLTVNTVTFPAEEFADGRIEPEMSYFFDFQAVLPSIIESNYRQRRVEVPFTLCVIAFAQAKLREAMFKMLLPASDLRRALGSVRYDEFHFADSTRGVNMTDREIVDSRTPTASQQTDDDSDDSDDDNDDNENNDDNDDNSKNDDNGKSDESSGLSLYTASLNGHARVVKLLLENDADVGAADGSRRTALHVSSQKGHIDVVKLLIDSGAETNCTSSYGSTPLNMASGRGHVEVAQLLLDNGADITTANNEGWTPLISASHEGHDGVVKLLLDNPKIDINAEDNIGRTPLFHAAAFGHGEVVQLLLSHKLVVNSKDRYNTTPLFAAARNGHENVVERLLAFEDVDINAKDGLGRTLDWWAIKSGNTGVIELVLQYAEKRGTQIRHTDLSVKGSPVKSGKLSRYCDVCTRRILDGSAYYHCTICNSDDFDICLECSGTGVQCLDSSHKWVLRE